MNGVTTQLMLIGGFFLFMYMVMIKPNKKRQEELYNMRNNVKVGDEIITIGGIKGTICEVSDTEIVLETSVEKNKIVFIKSAIHNVISKEEIEEIEEKIEEEIEEVEETE